MAIFLRALGLASYQIALLLFVTGGRPRSLVWWDAAWYRDIAVGGYQVALPITKHTAGASNIAFFPGFPLWSRAVIGATGMDPNLGVAVAAQLACVGMWAYFLLVLRELGVKGGAALLAVLAFLVQPGAFYFVVGYSESLFTFALLGYLYWAIRAYRSARLSWGAFALAALHGALLSSTRFVGVALCGFPVLLALARAFRDRKAARLPSAIVLSALALCGFLGFLLFAQLRWGRWDLYWESNRIGWDTQLGSTKLLRLSYWTDVFFFGPLPEVFGRMLTIATLVLLAPSCARAWRERARDAVPLALAALCAGLAFETIVGSQGMYSMIRYLLPIQAIALLLAAMGWSRVEGPVPVRRLAALALGGGFLLALQILFTIRYGQNAWVS